MSKYLNKFIVSDNFYLTEFVCPCCKTVKLEPLLVNFLQALRFALNIPIKVTSGYRCKKHNTEVGGVSNSLHLIGRAVDISNSGLPDIDILKLARKIGFKYCYYNMDKCYYHLDIGADSE